MTKKVMLLLFTCVFSLSLFAGCDVVEIVGNGKTINKSVSLAGSWDTIEIHDFVAEVLLSNEKSDMLEYSIDEDLEQYLDISVNNGKLIIKIKDNKLIKSKNDEGIKFYVGTDELKGINISGSTNLVGIGDFVADDFTLDTSGSSGITLNLICNKAEIRASGSGKINIQGKSETLNITSSGSGQFLGKGFISSDVTIDSSGSITAEIYATDNLNIKGSGSASITYRGEPSISQNTSGGFELIQVD